MTASIKTNWSHVLDTTSEAIVQTRSAIVLLERVYYPHSAHDD